MKDIKEFIYFICNNLKIQKPKVVYKSDFFPTETTMAIFDPENNILYLKNKDITIDTLLYIAHELRHSWQWENNKDFFFKDYESVEKLGLEKYNLQIAEIDANAYATVIMVDLFGVKPMWKGYSERVKKEIEKYIELHMKKK